MGQIAGASRTRIGVIGHVGKKGGADSARYASDTRERLAFFFELFFFGWAEPRRRAECLAVVEQRQIAHVQRERAGRRLLIDDDRDRAAFHAVAECDAAAASQPRR